MRSLGYGTLLSLACLGFVACTGDQGPPGATGPQGDPGTPAAATGTLTGTVTDGIAGDPLAGVTITATDVSGRNAVQALSGPDGRFSLTYPAGAFDLSIDKEFYTSPARQRIGMAIGQTVDLTIQLNEAATGKPSVSIAAPGAPVGYDEWVTLTASGGDPNGDPLTYTWRNDTVPELGAVTGDGPRGTVAMPSLDAAFGPRPDPTNPGQFISGYTPEDRFGVVPILTDTRGQVIATVTVTDGRGQSATASVTLSAASLHGGTRDVAVGQRIYLNSGHSVGNAWTLSQIPAGSTAVLDDPSVRLPSFVPDRPGSYTVGEGAHTMTITAGTWRGALAGGSGDAVTPDPDCLLCHKGTLGTMFIPDMFTPWLGTGHATMFTRGINGAVSDHYSGACIGCHTVGNDGIAGNGGFDDAARAANWTMPTMGATRWDSLVAATPGVARLANIQCESCHGPQDSAAHQKTWDANRQAQPFLSPRIAYAAENCATCHAAGSHHIYSEWTTTDQAGMGHANRGAMSFAVGATGLNASCGRCHTAQGYTLYARVLGQGKVALSSIPAATLQTVTPANAEPVTCVACHDPHDATNPSQLRFYGDTPNLPSGFAGHGMGKGALCLTCHNSRNGAQNGSDALTYLHEDGEPYNSGNPTGYSAPHQADQGDVFTGHNAYFLGASLPMTSKHAAIEDTCVGCHMTLQPRGYLSHGAPAASGHLFRIQDADQQKLCAGCHGNAVNGEGIQAQVGSQLAQLAGAMGNAVKTKIKSQGQVRVRAWDPATDLFSSTSASNVVLDLATSTITSVDVEEIHGQIGFVLHFGSPITVPFVDAGGNLTSKPMTSFGVQMGAIQDNQATPAPLYALSGNLVRAAWNYFLIEGDQSKGLHNPSFVNAVLNASLRKDLSN